MNKKLELTLQLLGSGIIAFILLYHFSALIMSIMKYVFYFISIVLMGGGLYTFYEFIKEKIHDKKAR